MGQEAQDDNRDVVVKVAGGVATYQKFVMDIYDRLAREFDLAVGGLTVEELNYRPKPESNSIGWLAWHVARSQDRLNADLFGEQQLWIRDKWYAVFGREANPNDTGTRHSAEQIRQFQSPDASSLMDYYHAVAERTKQYLTTVLSEADLSRQVQSPTLGTINTVEERLLGTIDNFQHIGQAGYLRGMLAGMTWYRR